MLMLVSITSGYLHGLWIHKARNTKYAKFAMTSSLVVGVGLLLYYKYIDFYI